MVLVPRATKQVDLHPPGPLIGASALANPATLFAALASGAVVRHDPVAGEGRAGGAGPGRVVGCAGVTGGGGLGWLRAPWVQANHQLSASIHRIIDAVDAWRLGHWSCFSSLFLYMSIPCVAFLMVRCVCCSRKMRVRKADIVCCGFTSLRACLGPRPPEPWGVCTCILFYLQFSCCGVPIACCIEGGGCFGWREKRWGKK
jgi:hypothetical protein